jgi:hypothetical protein
VVLALQPAARMRNLVLLFLAGCPASADSPSSPDAPTAPSCSTVPTGDVAVTPCSIVLDAMPREITAAADGSLYVVTASGSVEHHVAHDGCAFERDAAFVSPPGGWRSAEAASDGRIYLAKAEAGKAVLQWIGSSTGACMDTRAYKPVIGASGDGSVVMAPLTGAGLRRITTSPCGATELAFAASDEVRLLGRLDAGDVIYGTSAMRTRVAPNLDAPFRVQMPFAGDAEHSLEPFGTAIASWNAGSLHRVDAATGAELSPIAWDVPQALFDATPDGSAGYLLGSCGSLYQLR